MTDLVRTSKFLSLVLRHKPEKIGLTLDPQGWAEVSVLIELANKAGMPLTRDLLQQVVEENDKQRFAISSEGLRIRANQGHSIIVNLELVAVQPPDLLYHVTATRFLESISRQGLIPGSRQHVHLSTSESIAFNVGARHGRPHVLTVNSLAMYDAGHRFYCSENGVWLTEHVPVKWISGF